MTTNFAARIASGAFIQPVIVGVVEGLAPGPITPGDMSWLTSRPKKPSIFASVVEGLASSVAEAGLITAVDKSRTIKSGAEAGAAVGAVTGALKGLAIKTRRWGDSMLPKAAYMGYDTQNDYIDLAGGVLTGAVVGATVGAAQGAIMNAVDAMRGVKSQTGFLRYKKRKGARKARKTRRGGRR